MAVQKPIFDVRNFGAKADGEADDTVAIRNALVTAAENDGVVYLAPGLYKYNMRKLGYIPDNIESQC